MKCPIEIAQEVSAWRAMEKDHGDDEQRKKRRRDGLWKSREVEKSKSRLSHLAWKSRKKRGITTFPQPRRLREIN
jgi:hypothetical protein